jgi:NTE family protein
MKALVLGGGSLKGAFQVGVVQAILESGFAPDMVYGISVGSLNATYLVEEATRQHSQNQKIDWPLVSKSLIEFWIKNITHPTDIALEKSRFVSGFDALMSRFDGLLDPAPLHTLMRRSVSLEMLRQSHLRLKVGAVDIITGDMVYATPENDDFIEYVLASSALPMLMPAIKLPNNRKAAFLDGGLRVVAPLKAALHDGATDIMCVACHTEQMEAEPFNYRSFLKLIDRVKDINVNQLVNSEIAWAENYVEKENLKGNPLKLTVFRPSTPLKLDLLSFNSDDIARLIVQGFKEGFERVKSVG